MGGSIAIEAAGLMAPRVKGLMVSEPNFHAGGGMFSRSIAAQTEQQFTAQGMMRCSVQKPHHWAGSLQSNAPYAVWRGASSPVEGVEPEWEVQFCLCAVR